MTERTASRTLVKSSPELWAECSDPASLGRHLGEQFGEIRITRLEPETTVAWEGERASGTVRLEPAGWGTRVTLTASEAVARAAPPPEPDPPSAEPPSAETPSAEPPSAEPPSAEPPGPGPRTTGVLARLRARWARRTVSPEPAPEPAPPPAAPSLARPVADPRPSAPLTDPEAALAAALDSLGQAHHRPFSRA